MEDAQLGTPLLGGQEQGLARINRIGARANAAMALAAYLRMSQFVRWGGGAGVEDVPFRLCRVYEEWPDPDMQLVYPSASIDEPNAVVLEGHNFVPTPLSSTYEVFGKGTVLWKLAEISVLFQVDFWAQNKPEREAIAAALPSLFYGPQGASRIVLGGSNEYYGRSVRASLESHRRMDNPGTVYESERRLMSQIRCDVDVVELRHANVLEAKAVLEISQDI